MRRRQEQQQQHEAAATSDVISRAHWRRPPSHGPAASLHAFAHTATHTSTKHAPLTGGHPPKKKPTSTSPAANHRAQAALLFALFFSSQDWGQPHHSRAVQICISEVGIDQDCALCLRPRELGSHHLGVAEVSALQQHPAEHLAAQILVAEVTPCDKHSTAGQDLTRCRVVAGPLVQDQAAPCLQRQSLLRGRAVVVLCARHIICSRLQGEE